MPDEPAARERLRVAVRGAVQGVGFRPFVHRLATSLGLDGWVLNDASGVLIEVEGAPDVLRSFLTRLPAEKPRLSILTSVEPAFLPAAGLGPFRIRASEGGEPTAFVLPDVAPCDECLAEIRDPRARRHRYPFTNCTHCGPRYSIVEALPYDRPRTTMKGFAMCDACRAEYEDPRDRRFHAQPIACPDCGPRLELWAPSGRALASGEAALTAAVRAVASGRIVAIKGVGGFQLWCDAADAQAVRELRARKRRLEKPFALMVPDLAAARALASVDAMEERLLASAESPIVLLARRPGAPVAEEVAPGMGTLGVMLPSSPLHHLLLGELGAPVVATSGNLSEEPLATDERRALEDLRGLADLFLVHDRPIARPVDDSVAAVVDGRELILRRARGYAPLPVASREDLPRVLAFGGHLKGAVAAAIGRQVFVSQHLGDLSTERALSAYDETVARFTELYGFAPEAAACDLHPDYASTRRARASGARVVEVQHHHAHALSCLAENGAEPPALAVVWDGSGWGPDGTVWGGEFLRLTPDGFTRAARLRPFRLPGGEAAVREPRRSALAVLHALGGEAALERRELAPVAAFGDRERGVVARMIAGGLNSPWTTSAGRLFDAAAALAGVRQTATFEGQAAMELEALCGPLDGETPYPFTVVPDAQGLVLDWGPAIAALAADAAGRVAPARVAARFHAGLADAIVAVARRAGEPRVALTGGCFQNRVLLTAAARRLQAAGFQVLRHQRVPPNDGGLALGQAAAAARVLRGEAGLCA